MFFFPGRNNGDRSLSKISLLRLDDDLEHLGLPDDDHGEGARLGVLQELVHVPRPVDGRVVDVGHDVT